MGLRARDVVLSPSASEHLRRLERDPARSSALMARRIRSLRSVLLADCLHGEVVKKDRIPRVLRDTYGLENLYVEDLPSFWRLLYTIVRDRGERYVVVVEIADHEAYDRWFPGRGR